ncbi:MAG TPA: TRAP transporter small permease [Microvirga sp.]|jgi:TRAP-type C4-dicarboxylate transport system permease small subunit|nr:TRAP transporter small permease [Microvirga sp.]
MSELLLVTSRDTHAPADATAADRMLAPVRRFMRLAGLVLITVMIALPALQVFMREALGFSFIGAEELTRFALICLVFITFPYVIASGANIRLEELILFFPAGLRRAVHVLIALSGTVVLGIAAAAVVVATLRNLNNATPTLGIPYWIFFSAAFLGFLFAAIETLLQLWKALARRPLYVAFADEAPPDDMDALEAALLAQSDLAAADRAPETPSPATGAHRP